MKYLYIFEGESWGIELCGEGPTEIRRVRAGGPADYAGLQAGDIVLMANGINVTRFGHQEIDLHSLHQKINGDMGRDKATVTENCHIENGQFRFRPLLVLFEISTINKT